jgi:uncharacterized protein
MNRRIKLTAGLLIALLGTLVLSACAGAAPVPLQTTSGQNPPSISVTGNGVAYGSPDIAVAQIGVQSRDTDPARAVADANAKMSAIIAALKELGVEDKDIQTANFSVSAQQDFDPATGQPKGTFTYVVDNTVSVTVRDLSKVGDMLSRVVDAGANSIYGVNFSVSDQSALEAEARQKAMADAKARAEQLAQAAGVTLDAPLSISEFSTGPVPLPYAVDRAQAGGGGPVPVATGQVQVNLQVSVVYTIK